MTEAKTKTLTTRLKGLGIAGQPTLLVVSELPDGPRARRAQRAVAVLETPGHVSVYQLMRNERVVFEKAALLSLQEALSHEGSPRVLVKPLMTEKSMQQKEEPNTVTFRGGGRRQQGGDPPGGGEGLQRQGGDVRTRPARASGSAWASSRGGGRSWKKAMVTLAPGHKIELVEGA